MPDEHWEEVRMRLTLYEPTAVIRNLDAPAKLPRFTLITGVNGCGKSSLLQAISKGAARGGAARPEQHLPLYTWSDVLGTSSLTTTASAVRSGLQKLRQMRDQYRRYVAEQIRINDMQVTREDRISGDRRDQYSRMGMSEVESLDQTVRSRVSKAHGAANFAVNPEFQLLKMLSGDRFAGSLSDADLDTFMPGEAALFDPRLAELFLSYAQQLNRIIVTEVYAGNGVGALQAAKERLGDPPWEKLNRILSDLKLPFRVPEPQPNVETYDITASRENSARVQFEKLSGGEKVIFALAIAEFYRGESRQSVAKQNLILFDEIDAPLHPAMVSKYLAFIKTLVDDGTRVIATTHSPSTVALAPEEALFLLTEDKDGHRLSKVSKDAALSQLTDGVPTLAIDYSGRRQVFCESDDDARFYQMLFDRTKDLLKSGRSLTFVASGKEKDGGSARVKRLVNDLATGKNRTTLGLLDWDGTSNGSARIVVASHGIRHSIENLLLDPPLAIAAIMRAKPGELTRLGLSPQLLTSELLSFDASRFEAPIAKFVRLVLPDLDQTERTSISYVGGHTLLIPTGYLRMRGHDLEREVTRAFGCLIGTGNKKDVKMFVIFNVLNDFLGFLPMDVMMTFKDLTERPL